MSRLNKRQEAGRKGLEGTFQIHRTALKKKGMHTYGSLPRTFLAAAV